MIIVHALLKEDLVLALINTALRVKLLLLFVASLRR